MSRAILLAPHFHNEEAAFAFVEKRVWPDGPFCPHCGGFGRVGKLKGKSTRLGVYKCYHCRKPFTVRIGTIFEDSHAPLHLWLQAIYLIAASKKGISSNQLHRVLGVTLKTAWFMSHRIRLAMAVEHKGMLGGGGGIVEADETYIGRRKGMKKARGGAGHKEAVFAVVERKDGKKKGQVRSFHIGRVTGENLREALETHVAQDAHLKTDDARWYNKIAAQFASHETVNHTANEYVRDFVHHTNTIEGVFSVFKRGMIGVYQHCDGEHLHRYLSEFDFRYNNRASLKVDDKTRADKILKGIAGKRLTYRKLTRSGEVLPKSEESALQYYSDLMFVILNQVNGSQEALTALTTIYDPTGLYDETTVNEHVRMLVENGSLTTNPIPSGASMCQITTDGKMLLDSIGGFDWEQLDALRRLDPFDTMERLKSNLTAVGNSPDGGKGV